MKNMKSSTWRFLYPFPLKEKHTNKPTFSLLNSCWKPHISSATKQHLVDMAIVDSSRNPILLHRHDATETVIGCPNLSVDTIEGLWKTWSPGNLLEKLEVLFLGMCFFATTGQRGGIVFFYHLVFKFHECWFLPVLSHCFQLVSVHLFYVLQKLTITNAWTWWFSKFRISFRGH